jgi:hypothetical protein
VAGGQRLLNHESASAARGSKDYEVHRRSPDLNFSKLKLQVATLE